MRYQNYRFQVPREKEIRVITDTDAKNEADDPFAVVHTLLSPRFDNVGLIAAHFGTDRAADSMEQSFGELRRILSLMDIPEENLLFRAAASRAGSACGFRGCKADYQRGHAGR